MHQSFGSFEQSLASSEPVAEFRLIGILDFLRDHADDAIDAIGVDAAIAWAHGVYDTYCVPFNVPWVPDILEPTLIDLPAKKLIAAVITRVHERIHKD